MFLIDGNQRSAAYVATQLYQVGVMKEAKSFIESFFERKIRYIPLSKREQFGSKIFIYCEATVLRTLLVEKHRDARYLELVREFEKFIFPPNQTEGMKKLGKIRAAMKDIDRLIFDEKKLSWARNWLASIGHDETNPATLALLATLMGRHTEGIRQLIHDIGAPRS